MGLGGTKPHALDLTRNAIPNEPWWQMEHLLYTEAQQQRVTTLAGRPNHQHLLTGIDWHAYKQLKPKFPEGQQRQHLHTFVMQQQQS